MGRDVRVGVLGLRRGAALARLARQAGMRVVALCERDDRRREEAAGALGAAAYRDLEPFLDHRDMDAVLLVNDFDQHAPVAIRALERGLSVLSETAACSTLARASPWWRRPSGRRHRRGPLRRGRVPGRAGRPGRDGD
jgi:predicted dehydrogenase